MTKRFKNPRLRFITDAVDGGGAEEVPGAETEVISKTTEPAAPEAKAEAPAAKVEAPAADSETKPLVFDQAGVDRIIGERVRKERERADALEAQVNELMADKHAATLELLAKNNGVEKDLLVDTGLKGEALANYAKKLGAKFSTATPAAPAAGVSLSAFEKFGAVQASGVQLGSTVPLTMEAAMANIEAEIASANKG